MKWFTGLFTLHLIASLAFGKSEQKRALIFPPTSIYGLFVAIAVPIDIPDKNVFVSFNFEANYATLNNITEIDEAIFPNLPIVSRQSRSITREMAYSVLESRFIENGMNGRECLLRNICEVAQAPLHHDGFLGDIMHIIFTPSSSLEEGLADEYYEAELDGLTGNCDRYLNDCPYSLFDMITKRNHHLGGKVGIELAALTTPFITGSWNLKTETFECDLVPNNTSAISVFGDTVLCIHFNYLIALTKSLKNQHPPYKNTANKVLGITQ